MNTWPEFATKKIIAPHELDKVIADLRQQNRTIATLNGSFDLLHAGHLTIIYEASKQADILVVALNSDSSIKQYKDPSRPIVPLEYRLTMMAALEFVQLVTWFDETTPCDTLEKIRPDVHINGVEYGTNCIEADVVTRHGGKIHIVDLIPGLSTTMLINKIKDLCV